MLLFKKKPSRISSLPNFRSKFMHFSSPREINGKQAMIGNARAKFWYFFVAMFLLWFLLLYFCHSSSKVDKNRIRSNFNILGNVRESVSLLLHGNSTERAMQERKQNVESSTVVDASGDPVDSFIDSDLEKFIQQISDAEDGSMPESGKNRFPDKRNVAKDDGVVRKRSRSRKKSKSRSGKRKRITANKSRSIEKIPGEGNAAEGNMIEEPVDLLPADIRTKSDTDRKSNPGNEEHVVDQIITKEVPAGIVPKVVSDPKLCSGRYIYIHDIPSEYNEGLVQHCRSLSIWNNMCPFTSNFGLGPELENSEKVFSSTGWFETNQFMLEIVFHNRMKQYECLTNDSSLASAIFVPYYAGLDVTRMLWNSNWYVRDYNSLNLVKWLRERPEWKRMWGGDHFMVAGRIAWDFRRERNRKSDWGNKLMILPEARNMTILTIESSPWNQNDYAIPYPTYFHPSSDDEVFQWQNRMRRQRRPYLFSFAGAPRPNMNYSIRGEIINQCQAAGRKCQLLECVHGHGGKCYEPSYLMRMFQTSTFCLQPSGDSYTRRSTFDSILGGCIPVFFHPGSAYVQYLWHLPRDYTTYSVFIPEKQIKEGKVSIDEVLTRIPIKKVVAMREAVIKLIPQVVYADPRFVLTLKDAFDKTVDGVLERVRSIEKEMEGGKNPFDVVEEFTWKKNFFGIGTDEKHEWDPLFDRTRIFG